MKAALSLACALLPAAIAAPHKICSVSLAGDEWLALLVPAERIACVSSYADDAITSNVAQRFDPKLPRLTGRLEPVLGVHPDLVLAAPWNDETFLRTLRASGAATLVLKDVRDFAEIRAQALELARQLEAPAAQLDTLLRHFDSTLAEVDRLAAGTTKPRVLAMSHLIVAGGKSSVDALIRRAGGRNAAAEAGLEGHVQLSLERVIALDPDLLLIGLDEANDVERLLAEYPQLEVLRAIRARRVVVLAPRLLTTVTPFLADGALELAKRLKGTAP